MNVFKEGSFLISFGIIPQIWANVSVPYLTVLTFLVISLFSEGSLTLYLRGKTCFMISGESPFKTLYSSIARVWMFRSWVVKELSLIRSSSNEETFSSYTTRKDLSWILFIRLFNFRLWNIQTNGHYPN